MQEDGRYQGRFVITSTEIDGKPFDGVEYQVESEDQVANIRYFGNPDAKFHENKPPAAFELQLQNDDETETRYLNPEDYRGFVDNQPEEWRETLERIVLEAHNFMKNTYQGDNFHPNRFQVDEDASREIGLIFGDGGYEDNSNKVEEYLEHFDEDPVSPEFIR